MEAHVIGLDDQFSFSTDQMALLPDGTSHVATDRSECGREEGDRDYDKL